MNNQKQIFLAVISFGLFSTLLIAFLFNRSQLKKIDKEKERRAVVETSPSPTTPPVPTKTEEEKEIIRKIKTHEVKITSAEFEPAKVIIKPHDQVDWLNQSQTSCKLKAENWGGLEIRPGRRFTQSFEQIGVYPYSCQLRPEITGEIVVE